MRLATLIEIVVVFGLALYLLESYFPMSRRLKVAARVVVVLGLVLYLLSVFSLWLDFVAT